MGSVIDGVALGDIAHVGTVGAHYGDGRWSSFALDYAGKGFLSRTCGQTSNAKICGVEKAEFICSALAKEEHSANIRRREAVEKLARIAATAYAGDVYADVCGIVSRIASPEQTSGHELRACALCFPGVAVVDLCGAFADGLCELAIDGADRGIAQLEMELPLREIGVGITHGSSSELSR